MDGTSAQLNFGIFGGLLKIFGLNVNAGYNKEGLESFLQRSAASEHDSVSMSMKKLIRKRAKINGSRLQLSRAFIFAVMDLPCPIDDSPSQIVREQYETFLASFGATFIYEASIGSLSGELRKGITRDNTFRSSRRKGKSSGYDVSGNVAGATPKVAVELGGGYGSSSQNRDLDDHLARSAVQQENCYNFESGDLSSTSHSTAASKVFNVKLHLITALLDIGLIDDVQYDLRHVQNIPDFPETHQIPLSEFWKTEELDKKRKYLDQLINQKSLANEEAKREIEAEEKSTSEQKTSLLRNCEETDDRIKRVLKDIRKIGKVL